MQRAREIEQRSAYLDSQISRPARVIPGLNLASTSSSSSSSPRPVQTQSLTTQMGGMTMNQQV